MATAVKMDEAVKSRLEELQADIRLKTGQKVTQQEILARLINDAYESRSDLIDSFRESTVPASDEEIKAFNRGTFDSGVETKEEDVDDILYG